MASSLDMERTYSYFGSS